ncbi:MAG: hypothetical protein GY856_06770 [bacterium]|nr:hypothetical protein [bacterium]
MSWLDDPVTAALALPAFVLPLFILVSAMLEYVFPPYWGDSFVLLGFFLAGQGAVPPLLILVAALAGSTLGAAIAYALGRRFGMAAVRRVVFRQRRFRSRFGIRKFLLRFGEKVLVANRFLPVIRGLMLYGAGAMRLRFAPTMVYSALSNLAWVVTLMGVGLLTAGSWEQILESFRQYNRLIGIAAAVAVAGWLAFLLWRHRRDPEPAARPVAPPFDSAPRRKNALLDI